MFEFDSPPSYQCEDPMDTDYWDRLMVDIVDPYLRYLDTLDPGCAGPSEAGNSSETEGGDEARETSSDLDWYCGSEPDPQLETQPTADSPPSPAAPSPNDVSGVNDPMAPDHSMSSALEPFVTAEEIADLRSQVSTTGVHSVLDKWSRARWRVYKTGILKTALRGNIAVPSDASLFEEGQKYRAALITAALDDLRTDDTVSTSAAADIENTLDWPLWQRNWLRDLDPGSEHYQRTLTIAEIIKAIEGMDRPETRTTRQKNDLRRKRTTNVPIVQDAASRDVTTDEVARRCYAVEQTAKRGRDERYRQSWCQETVKVDLEQQSCAEGLNILS